MYTIILAAVDGSARAQGVVDAALAVAERFGGRVHLFRSVSVPPEFPPAAHAAADDLTTILATDAKRALEGLVTGNPHVVIEAPDLITAQPWRAVLNAAVRIRADLIVVGSHGYGGWDRVLGTNASQIADRADRSVLIVHEPAKGSVSLDPESR